MVGSVPVGLSTCSSILTGSKIFKLSLHYTTLCFDPSALMQMVDYNHLQCSLCDYSVESVGVLLHLHGVLHKEINFIIYTVKHLNVTASIWQLPLCHISTCQGLNTYMHKRKPLKLNLSAVCVGEGLIKTTAGR